MNAEKLIAGFYEKNGFKKISDDRLLYTFTNLQFLRNLTMPVMKVSGAV